MLAFYNGGTENRTFLVETDENCFRVLYGNAEGTVLENGLEVRVPAETLAIFSADDKTGRGIEKDGIVYPVPKTGGVICCESDAVAAHYKFYGGKRELIGLYVNGDTVMDGDGEIRFFRWDKMQPR